MTGTARATSRESAGARGSGAGRPPPPPSPDSESLSPRGSPAGAGAKVAAAPHGHGRLPRRRPAAPLRQGGRRTSLRGTGAWGCKFKFQRDVVSRRMAFDMRHFNDFEPRFQIYHSMEGLSSSFLRGIRVTAALSLDGRTRLWGSCSAFNGCPPSRSVGPAAAWSAEEARVLPLNRCPPTSPLSAHAEPPPRVCAEWQMGTTPLMAAASGAAGSAALVEDLLAAKASVEPAAKSGETALILAAGAARAGVVKALLAAKASTNVNSRVRE